MPARKSKKGDPKIEVVEAPSPFVLYIRRRIEQLREADDDLPKTDTPLSTQTLFARAIAEWKQLPEAERRRIVDAAEGIQEGIENKAPTVQVQGSATSGSLGHPLDPGGCAAQASVECEAELLNVEIGGEPPRKKRELKNSKEGKERKKKKKKKESASIS